MAEDECGLDNEGDNQIPEDCNRAMDLSVKMTEVCLTDSEFEWLTEHLANCTLCAEAFSDFHKMDDDEALGQPLGGESISLN